MSLSIETIYPQDTISPEKREQILQKFKLQGKVIISKNKENKKFEFSYITEVTEDTLYISLNGKIKEFKFKTIKEEVFYQICQFFELGKENLRMPMIGDKIRRLVEGTNAWVEEEVTEVDTNNLKITTKNNNIDGADSKEITFDEFFKTAGVVEIANIVKPKNFTDTLAIDHFDQNRLANILLELNVLDVNSFKALTEIIEEVLTNYSDLLKRREKYIESIFEILLSRLINNSIKTYKGDRTQTSNSLISKETYQILDKICELGSKSEIVDGRVARPDFQYIVEYMIYLKTMNQSSESKLKELIQASKNTITPLTDIQRSQDDYQQVLEQRQEDSFTTMEAIFRELGSNLHTKMLYKKKELANFINKRSLPNKLVDKRSLIAAKEDSERTSAEQAEYAKIIEMESFLEKATENELSLITEFFSQKDNNILSLNHEHQDLIENELKQLEAIETSKRTPEETQRLTALRMVYKITAHLVDIYFKELADSIDSKKKEVIRSQAKKAMTTFTNENGEEIAREGVIAIVLIGDSGSGKGSALAKLGVEAYGAGTNGVAGAGKYHEHFEKIVKSWDIARNSGFRMMHHMGVIFELGIPGMRNFYDQVLGINVGIIYDGYPRDKYQAEIVADIPKEQIRAIDVAFEYLDITARIRIGGYRAIEQYFDDGGIRKDVYTELYIRDKNQECTADDIMPIVKKVFSEFNINSKEDINDNNRGEIVKRIVQLYDEAGIHLNPNGRTKKYRKDFDENVIPALQGAGLDVVKIFTDNLSPNKAFLAIWKNFGININDLPTDIQNRINAIINLQVEN